MLPGPGRYLACREDDGEIRGLPDRAGLDPDRPQRRRRHPPRRPQRLPPPRPDRLRTAEGAAGARRPQPQRRLPQRRAGRVGAGSATATSWRSAATGSSRSKPERRGFPPPSPLAFGCDERRSRPGRSRRSSRDPGDLRSRAARARAPARGDRAGPQRASRRCSPSRRAATARQAYGAAPEAIRRELDELRNETRDYVKRKVRKSEKKLERSVRELDARTDKLERAHRPGRAGPRRRPSGASTPTPSRCSTACSTRSARSPTGSPGRPRPAPADSAAARRRPAAPTAAAPKLAPPPTAPVGSRSAAAGMRPRLG